VIAYEVRIKLNSGGRVSRELESPDKGKWIIDAKDISSRRVCRRVRILTLVWWGSLWHWCLKEDLCQ